jgi:hypothetical protein
LEAGPIDHRWGWRQNREADILSTLWLAQTFKLSPGPAATAARR